NYINVSNAIFLVFLACVPGLFIGSLVTGKRSYALLSSTIGILPIIGFTAYVMYISNPLESSILYIVLMAQQYLTIAVICAIIGGGLIEKRRLFPLQEKEETKARIAVQKETIPPPPPDYQQTQPPTYQQAPQPQKQSNDEDYYAEQSFKNDEW
ncbi:MAG: hypothetical protein U9O98_01205, partial [Asgard group archaeon]|nr:hypothetical protein [Asgard group archaeon]